MRPHNSFTSSSEGQVAELPGDEDLAAAQPPPMVEKSTGPTVAQKWRRALGTLAWMVLFLTLADVGVNRLFAFPRDPKAYPTPTQQYFEYGRSLEGKLARMIGPTDETTSPQALAGWLQPATPERLPPRKASASGLPRVTIYGMSFSEHVAAQLKRLEPGMDIRISAGPAAPPNQSYAQYLLDRGHDDADVVVLGILGSSVKGMGTLTSLTWMFESPSVYTYPKFVERGGTLEEIWPEVRSLDDLRHALASPPEWQRFCRQLSAEDRFYDPVLMHANAADHSAIVRVLRRAWAQRHMRNTEESLHTGKGFNMQDEIIASLNGVVAQFAKDVRADGKMPVVMLFQDRGYGDDVYRALAGTLQQGDIPYVSSHTICPATDPANFLADGHFTPACDARLAAALLEVIRKPRQ